MNVDPKFIVRLRNNDYITWPGILDISTKAGLRCLETKIIQPPTKENGYLAICEALATFEDGRTFSDIGDASPQSTSANLVPAIIRLASTRAKGRVLRDACNIGAEMAEDAAEADQASDHPTPAPTQRPVRHEAPRPQTAAQRPPTASHGPDGRQASPPLAAAPPGQQAPLDEAPSLTCGWKRCRKEVSREHGEASLKTYGHVICLDHLGDAERYFSKQQPAVIIEVEPGADAGLIPTVSAQAQGF